MIVRLSDYHTVADVSKADAAISGEESPTRKPRRARTRTLEFDLGLAPARKTRVAKAPIGVGGAAAGAVPGARTEPPAFRSGPRSHTSRGEAAEVVSGPEMISPSASKAESKPEPQPAAAAARGEPDPAEPELKEPSMNPTQPAPLNVKKTIERQSREQHAMSHLLNGVAISFVCAIVLVAGLAGLGGYVLYKQLKNQSATIALLETNTLERFTELEGRLAARNRELAELQHEANLRLTSLQGQFDQYRSQTTQSISLLTSANARLERRLAEYRQELLRQEQLLSLNEPTPVRRLR